MQLYAVEIAETPAALAAFPCKGWVKLTDNETGDTAIGAVLHRTGWIQVPNDVTKSDYGITLDKTDCAETIRAANALFD